MSASGKSRFVLESRGSDLEPDATHLSTDRDKENTRVTRIMTWNIMARKYAPREMDREFANSRYQLILERILNTVPMIDVVCLQEVDDEFRELAITSLHGKRYVYSTASCEPYGQMVISTSPLKWESWRYDRSHKQVLVVSNSHATYVNVHAIAGVCQNRARSSFFDKLQKHLHTLRQDDHYHVAHDHVAHDHVVQQHMTMIVGDTNMTLDEHLLGEVLPSIPTFDPTTNMLVDPTSVPSFYDRLAIIDETSACIVSEVDTTQPLSDHYPVVFTVSRQDVSSSS